jgi:hypothetical protein
MGQDITLGPAEVMSKQKLAHVNCEYQEAGHKETGGRWNIYNAQFSCQKNFCATQTERPHAKRSTGCRTKNWSRPFFGMNNKAVLIQQDRGQGVKNANSARREIPNSMRHRGG